MLGHIGPGPSAAPVDQISVDDELHKRAVGRVDGADLAGHLCARPKHTDALLCRSGTTRDHRPNALDDLFERHWRTCRRGIFRTVRAITCNRSSTAAAVMTVGHGAAERSSTPRPRRLDVR